MSWFKKKARPVDTAAVSPLFTFWSWWSGSAKDRFAAAITSGTWADLPTEMSDRVHAIHPDLQWELSAGTRAQHTLCVTSAGTAELRPLAQRWKRAGPAEDDIWQYEPARRRDATVSQGQVELDGHTLDLGETLVSAVLDEHRLRFDVVVHHPQFARIEEGARQQFTFLVLDWALGEDDVERWVGAVETAVDTPTSVRSISDFVAAVDSLAAEPVEERWVLLQGLDRDGLPVVALARRPLRWIDSPLLDQHNEVTLSFTAGSNGLPTEQALARLRELEQALSDTTGPRAQLLAHETHRGRRRLHVYSDSEDQNITESIDRWGRSLAEASVTITLDPAWRAVRHLA